MSLISIRYATIWRLKFAEEYQWTKDGLCINAKRGTILRQVYKNRSIGYNIRGKFYSLSYLRSKLERIQPHECPF